DAGSFAVVLALAAAALHAAGGRYGDDADNDWSLDEVLAEYGRERERLLSESAAITPAKRAALTEGPCEALRNARAAELCARGREAELAAFCRRGCAPAASTGVVLDLAWRGNHGAAARAAIAAAPPALAVEALLGAFNVMGATGVRQASFLVEEARVLSVLQP